MGPVSRRSFLGQSAVAGVGLAALGELPAVHAAGSGAIKVGLVGCGGRGTGAAAQALNTGPDVRVTALGDMFKDRLDSCREALKREAGERCAVTPEKCFVGFDAYKQVLASDVDVVLLCEPPHFRPAHLKAAVAAGKHVFAEKPCAVDGPGVRSVLATAKEAADKKLSLVAGFMLHYEPSMQATVEQVQQGAVGDVKVLQCNYNVGGLWFRRREPGWSDMEHQLRNWYYYTWLSGDHNVEQHVHCLDLVSWVMKGEYPARAVGLGGRQARTGPEFGHIFDHHAVVYEYPSGMRCFSYCRQQNGTAEDISNWVFGTKGTADLMRRSIKGEKAWTYRGGAGRTRNPGTWGGHQEEQDALFDSVRKGKPINNGEYLAKSSLMAIMGRMATYTGQVITWEGALNSKEDLTPPVYDLKASLPEPKVAVPGVTKFV